MADKLKINESDLDNVSGGLEIDDAGIGGGHDGKSESKLPKNVKSVRVFIKNTKTHRNNKLPRIAKFVMSVKEAKETKANKVP